MRKHLMTTSAAMLLAMTGVAFADMDAARSFLDAEIGDMSALDRAAQEAEMQWFIDAAQPFQGMDIKVVSETITTHEYESKVLAPAFTALNRHQDHPRPHRRRATMVEKLQTRCQSGENIYDALCQRFRPDRHPLALPAGSNLTDWMANEGADVTSPTLDVEDFNRQVLHHRARRQALPAADAAVRQPLLLPLRLVQRRDQQGRVQGKIRL